MKKNSNKMTRQGFIVLVLTLSIVALSLLAFAFNLSDAEPMEVSMKYTKMLEYILASLLLSVGGALLTDYIFRG